ncbi:MAG: hypothetical protein HY905_27210 [Deltaproteobacteria bacterium]|nr:hypothetical protein [Deltaproteobacteria bacterium]
MPKPLAICIEDLEPRDEGRRYLRCVAVVGRRPGLRVSGDGTVIWKSDAGVACELWVSGDDKLILYRPEGAPPVVCRRAGRSLDVPAGKPVVLLDEDQFDAGGRRLRVHVHGTARAVHEPSFLPAPRPASGLPKAAAAAVALGAVLGAADCKKAKEEPGEVEVRAEPPSVTASPFPGDAGTTATADAGGPTTIDAGLNMPLPEAGADIEVRVAPPAVAIAVAQPLEADASDAGAASGDAEPASDAVAIEVRESPPKVAFEPDPEPAPAEDAGTATSDAGQPAPDAAAAEPEDAAQRRDATIEVRERPPDMMMDE